MNCPYCNKFLDTDYFGKAPLIGIWPVSFIYKCPRCFKAIPGSILKVLKERYEKLKI